MQAWSIFGQSVLVAAAATLAASGIVRLFGIFTGDSHGSLSRWAHRLQWIGWLASSAGLGLLAALFLADAFAFAYVADRSIESMHPVYKVTAIWAGQEGSLLLWLWMQAGYGVWVAVRARRGGAQRPLDEGAAGIMALISGFFAVLVAGVVAPFALRLPAPVDGLGMNPILQSYWMASHPIMLYLGYVGLSVPFSYALSSLMTRQEGWITITRRWSLIAWTFLSVGILYGARWAYEELGWGGYWGWDPVENASLMPWLVATAFIHSGIIEEKRGMLKRWNHGLVFATYLLTVFGTFITRSGILSSVHAFVESDISPWFIGYMGVVTFAFLYWLIQRWSDLKDERSLQSPLSKESSFLANNVVLMATMFAVFWGTVFPLVSQLFGRQVTVGTPYFNRVTVPLFLALILLMGIGPLISWRRASAKRLKEQFAAPVLNGVFTVLWLLVIGVRHLSILLSVSAVVFVLTTIIMEFVKGVQVRRRSRKEPWWLALYRLMNRSPGRYGGYVVHLGVLFVVVGIAFSQVYQEEKNVVLAVGDTAHIGRFSVTLHGLEEADHAGVPAVEAHLLVRDADGRAMGYLHPSKRFHPGVAASMGPTTQSAIFGTWGGDLYAVLAGWEAFGAFAGLKLYYNPVVWLIWAGGGLVVFGGLFSFWPRQATLSYAERAAVALAEIDYDFQMGKVDRSQYRAVAGDLSDQASIFLAQERRTVDKILSELKRSGLVVLFAAMVLGAAFLSQTAHANEGNAAALAIDGLSGDLDIPDTEQLVIVSETVVLRWEDGHMAVLDLIHATNVGGASAEEVRLPLPEGFVVTTADPPDLDPDSAGLIDRTGLLPGESRRYAIQFVVPAHRWPYGFTRDQQYPIGELTVMVQEGELEASGLDWEDEGVQSIADHRFSVFSSHVVDPDNPWHLTVWPGPHLADTSGWDPAVRTLPILAELDRFPGDWIVQRIVRYPRMAVALALLAVIVAAAMVRRARSFDRRVARADSDAAAMTWIRAVARLDMAFEAGGIRAGVYRRRRARLMRRIRHAVSSGGLDRIERQLRERLEKGVPHAPSDPHSR